MADLKAVVFDYYETLADVSPGVRERMFDDLARDLGVDLSPGEAMRHWRDVTTKDADLRLGGTLRPPLEGTTAPFLTFREVWDVRSRDLFSHWGVDAPPERGIDAYFRMHVQATAYPEVSAVLEALRERYELAILSDADSGFLRGGMQHNGFTFETVVDSEQMRTYKPHVSLFREACERLGVEPAEAVYVGDNPWSDIAGARNAGMGAVWVNRHDAEWPEDVEPPPAEIASLAELAGVLA